MNEQTRQRLLNLEALVEAGFQPYPYRYPKTHSAKEILSAKEGAPPESEWEEEVALAGRIVALRRMGKVTFAHLLDESGKIQLYFQKDLTPSYELLKKLDVPKKAVLCLTTMILKYLNLFLKLWCNKQHVLCSSFFRPLNLMRSTIFYWQGGMPIFQDWRSYYNKN